MSPIVEPSGQAAGGGSTPGAATVRGPFAFTFATADLNEGVAFYTPTIGDLLLDGWFEIDTAWDGTTPNGDIGTFSGVTYGIMGGAFSPQPMTSADVTGGDGAGAGMLQGENLALSVLSAIVAAQTQLEVNGAGPALQNISPRNNVGDRFLPLRFTAADPLKVVVSQDGTAGGDDPGSTQGAAKVYIITATPAAFS